MAAEVMIVLVAVKVNTDSSHASGITLSMLLVVLSLLGRMRPRADVADVPMIPAFGEILGRAVRADGAGAPLSSTHYAL